MCGLLAQRPAQFQRTTVAFALDFTAAIGIASDLSSAGSPPVVLGRALTESSLSFASAPPGSAVGHARHASACGPVDAPASIIATAEVAGPPSAAEAPLNAVLQGPRSAPRAAAAAAGPLERVATAPPPLGAAIECAVPARVLVQAPLVRAVTAPADPRQPTVSEDVARDSGARRGGSGDAAPADDGGRAARGATQLAAVGPASAALVGRRGLALEEVKEDAPAERAAAVPVPAPGALGSSEYAAQLAQLRALGFTNESTNMHLLTRFKVVRCASTRA